MSVRISEADDVSLIMNGVESGMLAGLSGVSMLGYERYQSRCQGAGLAVIPREITGLATKTIVRTSSLTAFL
jgi:hypothetical protein